MQPKLTDQWLLDSSLNLDWNQAISLAGLSVLICYSRNAVPGAKTSNSVGQFSTLSCSQSTFVQDFPHEWRSRSHISLERIQLYLQILNFWFRIIFFRSMCTGYRLNAIPDRLPSSNFQAYSASRYVYVYRGLLHKIVRFETYLPVGTFPGGRYV